MPSFVKTRGTKPALVAEAKLRIGELSCRGRANLLTYFLDRDDLYRVPGYVKIEAWPSPGIADVHVLYDPTATNAAAIQSALTQPYYDALADTWRMSPFQIQGHDSLALPPLPDAAGP